MKITVFGATGGTGRQFIQQACAAGHDVTAVVRDPARITGTPGHLRVVPADVMDPEAIGPAVVGRDAVVSALGSRAGRVPTTVCADGTASIVGAMRATQVRRLVVVSAGTLGVAGDGPLTRLLVKPLLGRLLEHTIADKRRMEEIVCSSGLEWTIVRPPQLTDGPHTGTYRTAVHRNVRGARRVSRADLADCILRCLTSGGPLDATVGVGY